MLYLDIILEAYSLLDIHGHYAIAEPSFFAPTNRPPTPTPLFTQLQQPPILTPATTPSSSLLNLPNFGSLFGFDNRLKALEDNFLEFKQTNQYAKALSPSWQIVDAVPEYKMKEALYKALVDAYEADKILLDTYGDTVEIVEWQNYKHLDWITVRRDDDILYKFKEGDFHRLRIQDLKQAASFSWTRKVTNLNVEEHLGI
ncbi:hypothetical protein Tco_1502378 [Tanacetum coccineum]